MTVCNQNTSRTNVRMQVEIWDFGLNWDEPFIKAIKKWPLTAFLGLICNCRDFARYTLLNVPSPLSKWNCFLENGLFTCLLSKYLKNGISNSAENWNLELNWESITTSAPYLGFFIVIVKNRVLEGDNNNPWNQKFCDWSYHRYWDLKKISLPSDLFVEG